MQQLPPQISMASAREEAEMVLFDSVKHVLESTGLKPGQVCFTIECSAVMTRLDGRNVAIASECTCKRGAAA